MRTYSPESLVCHSLWLIKRNIWNFIRFWWRWICDWLDNHPHKYQFYKIIWEIDCPWLTHGLVLKWYMRKKNSILPDYNWNQTFEIIDKKTFNKLPTYC